MRRSLFLAILLGVLPCAVSAAPITALSPPQHPPHAAAAQPERAGFTFVGRVRKVQYAANSLVMTTNGSEVTIEVTPTTAIDVEGQPGSIADIRPGVRIRAEGVRRDGAFVAVTITVL